MESKLLPDLLREADAAIAKLRDSEDIDDATCMLLAWEVIDAYLALRDARPRWRSCLDDPPPQDDTDIIWRWPDSGKDAEIRYMYQSCRGRDVGVGYAGQWMEIPNE